MSREIATGYSKVNRWAHFCWLTVAMCSWEAGEGLVVAARPPIEQLQPLQRQERSHFSNRA